MDRDIPVFNKIIMNKIHQKNMEIHYKNLINIRKSKKSKMSSTSTSFYKPNSKTYQIEQQKKTQIDKNNIILFQKINDIVTRGNSGNNNLSRKISSKKEIQHFDKIYQQNKKLVDRIANLKPTIDNKKLMMQRKKQLGLLKFIGKYSKNTSDIQLKIIRLKDTYKIGKFCENDSTKYRVKTQNFTKEQDQQDQFRLTNNWNMSMGVRPHYNAQNKSKLSPKIGVKPIQSSLTKYQQSLKKQNKSIYLFKRMKKIGTSSIIFSIIRTHNNYQIVAEQICQGGKSLKIELGEQKGKKLLQSIDYDYERLIQNLSIEDSQLMLAQSMGEVRKESKSRTTPKVNKRKISQMLPSHITQLNEEQYNIEKQEDVSEDQSIMNTFLSFGDNS